MTAGVLRDRVRDQFHRYISSADAESGFTRWARSVLDLTEDAISDPSTGSS